MRGKRLAAFLLVGLLLGGAAAGGIALVRRTVVLSRVALTRAMMAGLGDALTAYQQLYGSYMPWIETELGPAMHREIVDRNLIYALNLPIDPTTMSDPFGPAPDMPFRYWTDGENWTLWSAGPNRRYDILSPDVYAAPHEKLEEAFTPWQYDPTNGVRSAGDVTFLYRPTPQPPE